MAERYTVREGDSISSIAGWSGLADDTIWNDPNNAGLRGRRSRRDALAPGDVVYVPDLCPKEVACATDARHVFRRKGVPIRFRLQLFDLAGKPLAGRFYTLEVDGRPVDGRTDGDGVLVQPIPNGARHGRLLVDGEPERPLLFGELDPIETVSGVQHRLTNMGFACTGDGGAMGRATAIALVRFQRFAGLKPTAALDAATREAIRACHDDDGAFRRIVADASPPALA